MWIAFLKPLDKIQLLLAAELAISKICLGDESVLAEKATGLSGDAVSGCTMDKQPHWRLSPLQGSSSHPDTNPGTSIGVILQNPVSSWRGIYVRLIFLGLPWWTVRGR